MRAARRAQRGLQLADEFLKVFSIARLSEFTAPHSDGVCGVGTARRLPALSLFLPCCHGAHGPGLPDPMRRRDCSLLQPDVDVVDVADWLFGAIVPVTKQKRKNFTQSTTSTTL